MMVEKERKIEIFVKILEIFGFLGLLFGAGLFVKSNIDTYAMKSTSILFSIEKVDSYESPVMMFCFTPMAKPSKMIEFNISAKTFTTHRNMKHNTNNSLLTWPEVYEISSYRIGRDFSIKMSLNEDEDSILEINGLELDGDLQNIIQVEEIKTLWLGLCTKIKPKIQLLKSVDSYVKMYFSKSLNNSDIPKVRLYLHSEGNSRKSLIDYYIFNNHELFK